jgi:ParB family chromosome partitioning protein
VTLAAYEEAGGTVRRDLFSDGEDGVFIDDIPLLERLVAKKLQATAAEVRAQGWKWVEIRAAFDPDEWSACDHIFPESAPLTSEQQAEITALTAEADALAEIQELDDEQQARFDAIDDRIREIEDTPDLWPPESLAIAGAVVTLDRNGAADIRCGYVRPEDAPAPSDCPAATRSEKPKSGKPPLPASLIESLTAHRSAAITAALLQQPGIALAAVVHALALPLFYGGARPETSLQITSRTFSLDGVEGSPAAQMIGLAEEEWVTRMPCNPDDLFAWCLAQDTKTLSDLLTFCVARTVNGVIGKAGDSGGKRLKHASMLAEALSLDMTAWFAIIEAVREATGATAPAWEAMKKAELAALAERKIAGTGWLPKLLRSPALAIIEAAA